MKGIIIFSRLNLKENLYSQSEKTYIKRLIKKTHFFLYIKTKYCILLINNNFTV